MDILTSIVWVLTDWVWPFFLFLFGLGVVVFVHELGHFLVAKAVGIKVERFAIGFGPRLFGYRGRETDYCVMMLPLGGYVKMLGQEDFAPLDGSGEAPDPRSYAAKSVGARFAVIAAGVTMNVIFAGIMFVILGMVGMSFQAPVVGDTLPGFPADEATIVWLDESGEPLGDNAHGDQPSTLQPGDRIDTIDGKGLMIPLLGREVMRYRRVAVQALLSDVTDRYTLGISRKVGDGKKVLRGRVELGLKMAPSPSGSGETLPAFGIAQPASTKLVRGGRFAPKPEGGKEIFRNRDRIVAINGQKVVHNWDIREIEETLLGRETKLTIERIEGPDTSQLELTVRPAVTSAGVFYLKDGEIVRGTAVDSDAKKGTLTLRVKDGPANTVKRTVAIKNLANSKLDKNNKLVKELLDVLGMIPRLKIAAVLAGSPSDKAGLRPGDIVVSYGGHTAPTHVKLLELNEKFAADGADIVVMRDGKNLAPIHIRPSDRRTGTHIGISPSTDQEHLIVAGVRENSPAADLEMEILPGDVVEKVNGREVNTWVELLAELNGLSGKDVTLTMARGSRRFEGTIRSLDKDIFHAADYDSDVVPGPWMYRPLMEPKESRGPLDALVWGARETMFFIATSYATIRSLAAGSVSAKEVGGPVRIGSMAIEAGRRSMLDFAYFMAMISVSLAVVNFLPFPVVDGGHALFLIIEKIRGKPLSVRIMNVVQMFGLAVILTVFVLVTWNDINSLLDNLW